MVLFNWLISTNIPFADYRLKKSSAKPVDLMVWFRCNPGAIGIGRMETMLFMDRLMSTPQE